MRIRLPLSNKHLHRVECDDEIKCSTSLQYPAAKQIYFSFCKLLFTRSSYIFQRWMFRFEQRWRVQRSAISIVNCRIPWADRVLNTCCAFGIYLKVCLLQCSFHCFNKCLRSVTVSFCASICVRLRVFTLEACDWNIICVPVSLLMFQLLETFCAHCIVTIAFIICSTTS